MPLAVVSVMPVSRGVSKRTLPSVKIPYGVFTMANYNTRGYSKTRAFSAETQGAGFHGRRRTHDERL